MFMSFFRQSRRNEVYWGKQSNFSPYSGLLWWPTGWRSKLQFECCFKGLYTIPAKQYESYLAKIHLIFSSNFKTVQHCCFTFFVKGILILFPLSFCKHFVLSATSCMHACVMCEVELVQDEYLWLKKYINVYCFKKMTYHLARKDPYSLAGVM